MKITYKRCDPGYESAEGVLKLLESKLKSAAEIVTKLEDMGFESPSVSFWHLDWKLEIWRLEKGKDSWEVVMSYQEKDDVANFEFGDLLGK